MRPGSAPRQWLLACASNGGRGVNGAGWPLGVTLRAVCGYASLSQLFWSLPYNAALGAGIYMNISVTSPV